MRRLDMKNHLNEEQDQFLLLALLSIATLFGLFVVMYPQTVMFRTSDEQRAQSHVIKTLQHDLVRSENKRSLPALRELKQNDLSIVRMLAGLDKKHSK